MKTPATALATLCALSLLAAPAAAQGTVDDLTAGLSGYDGALEGERWFGVYMADQSIGRFHLTVSPAPGGSGATYRLEAAMEMSLGDFHQAERATSLLDAGWARVRTETEGERNGEPYAKTVSRAGDAWTREVTRGGETTTRRLESSRPDYEPMTLAFLLSTLGDPPAGVYAVPMSDWPEGGEGEPELVVAEVTVGALEPFTFRGEEVRARHVRIVRGEEVSISTLAADGRLLEVRFEEGSPIRMLAAADRAEADADLAGAGAAVDGGAESPRAAVRVFMEVLAKTREVDDLDQVVDWAAVQVEMAAEDPGLEGLAPATVGSLFKDHFASEEAGLTQAQVDEVIPELVVEVDGDQATVGLADRDDPYRLVRRDGRWWITHMGR